MWLNERRHYHIAASLQGRLEEAVLHLTQRLYQETRQTRLCMAGGVAFNCVVNSRILRDTPFEALYIQPAAGDAGLAIGAAFYVWHQVLGRPRSFTMTHAYWGPEYHRDAIATAIAAKNLAAHHRIAELSGAERDAKVASEIAQGKIVGWFQGRMEWGPRALGNRSILVDPRKPEMKEILNRRIKHRETFRPFARRS